MLILLFNNDRSKSMITNSELFFDILKSRDEFEVILSVLKLQFELESLFKSEKVEIIIQEKPTFEKICNLIRKRIN